MVSVSILFFAFEEHEGHDKQASGALDITKKRGEDDVLGVL